MATKDVKEFNGWFDRSYARLKEKLSIYGKIDEDAFHGQSGNRSCSQAAESRSWNPISSDATGESYSRGQGMKAVTTAPETSISQDWARRTARKRQKNGKRC